MSDKARIGWIGTGVMGSAMAGHLLAAGYPLTVHSRTKSKCQPLLDGGAAWAASPAEVGEASDIVFSIVGYPRDVEEVTIGGHGCLAGLSEGGIICDMTTSSPALARRIAEEAAGRGRTALDAPVTGGDIGAREARLSIFVGGERAAYEKILPCLEVMGKKNPALRRSGRGAVRQAGESGGHCRSHVQRVRISAFCAGSRNRRGQMAGSGRLRSRRKRGHEHARRPPAWSGL